MKRLMVLTIIVCWWELLEPSKFEISPPSREFKIFRTQETFNFQKIDGVWMLDGQKINPLQIEQLQKRLRLCDAIYTVADELKGFLTFEIDGKKFTVGSFNQISKRYPIQYRNHRYFCRPELISLLFTQRKDWL